jgi:hypothetical protein
MADPRRSFAVSPSVASNAAQANTYAVQAWVNQQDGTAPTLQTLLLDCVAIYPVDPNGNLLEQDEVLAGAAWNNAVLSELRAIRLGMEILTQNERFIPDETISLIEKAQSMAEDLDTTNTSYEASDNKSPGIG